MTKFRIVSFIGILLAANLSSTLALAAPSQPTQSQMDEARRRYARALELSDEGNYDDALLELQRAYALAPTYRLLYNLGVVSVAVHDYVKAIDYYNRYLSEGGADIEAARAAEVQAQLERLRTRIAKVTIDANVAGAEVSVDDVVVGTSPLTSPITVNAGRHKITAVSSGYFPASSVVEVAGNESKKVSLSLLRPASSPPEKPSRPIVWIGWGVTAALGVGTAVTGVLALNAESDYDKTVGTFGVTDNDVNSAYKKMRTWSITSDVLLGTTVVAAAISLYITIKQPKASISTSTGLLSTPGTFRF
jgi:hypothetical protein